MKARACVLSLVAATPAAAVAAPAAEPASVVVHPDGAMVARQTSVPCPTPGARLQVSFPALPGTVDPDSIHADAGAAPIHGVTWARARGNPEAAGAAAGWRRRLAEVTRLEAALQRRLARAEASAQRASGYGGLAEAWASRALWRPEASPASWAGAVEAVLEAAVAGERERLAARAELRPLEEERRTLERRLQALPAASPDGGGALEATVHLSCPASARPIDVGLRYLVTGASWQPSYEVRADPARAQVELVTVATVRQSTGEDWRRVRLSLSTNNPRDRATPPEPAPLVVWAEKTGVRKQIVAGAERIDPPPSVGRGGAGAAAIGEGQRLTAVLAVPGEVTVASDGATVRVVVARTPTGARLRLRGIPKMAPAIFRVADLVNRSPFPLLREARIAVFHGTTFIGMQPLASDVPRGGTVTVSFGVEERVRVSRTILREVERNAGVLGRARHHRFAYRFHLASHLPTREEVELVDHLPLSELEDVAVVIERATTDGFVRDARDGLVTWRLPLRPGQERSVDLSFRVEVPGQYR